MVWRLYTPTIKRGLSAPFSSEGLCYLSTSASRRLGEVRDGWAEGQGARNDQQGAARSLGKAGRGTLDEAMGRNTGPDYRGASKGRQDGEGHRRRVGQQALRPPHTPA